ncbi:MAG: biotin-dependent carboxyltransferase family protein [Pseudomonadota bacterium]
MTGARFKIISAGPLVSFQDAGRRGHLRYGVPASGPMDRFSLAAANAILGQDHTKTCIEVSLAGLALQCIEGATVVSIAGGAFRAKFNDQSSEGWAAFPVIAGDVVKIAAGPWGSWCYVGFSGDVELDPWLQSTSTHSTSGLGGGFLAAGAEFTVNQTAPVAGRAGGYETPEIATPITTARIVVGPQDSHFTASALSEISQAGFQFTGAFDRMGIRLSGPMLSLNDALSIPSEPITRGSIQVSGDGVPTILMADHQTTGGYPKIATVISADLDQLAQLRSGDTIRFQPVSTSEAIEIYRTRHWAEVTALDGLSEPALSLEEKLMQSNLISGVITD